MDAQWVTSIFDVSQHRGHDHDGQTDPEESKESVEVMIIALRIEMRNAGNVVDGIEQTASCSHLFPGGRKGVDGGRRIFRHGG